MEKKYPALGVGYNNFKKEQINKVLNVTPVETNIDASSTIYVCTTAAEITTHLGIDSSLSVEYGPATFEAKASYAKDLMKSTNTVTILVTAQKTFEAEVQAPSFSRRFGTAEELVEQGGDSYISKVHAGAQYFAAYQYVTTTVDQREKIEASAKGKFGGAAKVEASAQSKLESITTETNTTYSLSQRFFGCSYDLPTPDKVVEFALNFAGKDIETPQLLSFETKPYLAVAECPQDFRTVDKWITADKSPSAFGFPFSLASMEHKAILLKNNILSIQGLYRFYGQEERAPKLSENLGKLEEIRARIADWRKGFDPTNANIPRIELDTGCFETPSARFSIIEGEESGKTRPSGSYFNDLDHQSVHALVYPKSFVVFGGGCIDKLVTTYGVRNPEYPSDDTKETTFKTEHGGDGGSELQHHDSFYQTDIWHTKLWWMAQDSREDYHGCITKFEIWKKSSASPVPFGLFDGPNWKDEDVPDKDCFLGWRGRYGRYVDALQALYVRFEEAFWDPLSPDGS